MIHQNNADWAREDQVIKYEKEGDSARLNINVHSVGWWGLYRAPVANPSDCKCGRYALRLEYIPPKVYMFSSYSRIKRVKT